MKKMFNFSLKTALLSIMVVLAGCNKDVVTPPEVVEMSTEISYSVADNATNNDSVSTETSRASTEATRTQVKKCGMKGISTDTTIVTVNPGKKGDTTVIIIDCPDPVSIIEVTPTIATIFVGEVLQFNAAAKDKNGNELDVSKTWSSSNDAVSIINQNGVAIGVSAGVTTITAAVDSIIGTSSLTVMVAPIAPVSNVTIVPESSTVEIGSTVNLVAVLRDSAGNRLDRPVEWVSSDVAVATISNTGLVTGVAAGIVTITATSEGKSDVSTVTVTTVVSPPPVFSVEVTPTNATIDVSERVQLSATLKDSTGRTITDRVVEWTSDNIFVATVSTTGLVTGVNEGNATIFATSEGKIGTSAIVVETVPPPPPPPPPPPSQCALPWPAGVPTPMPQSVGDTFYVALNGSDANSGRWGSPWQTIQKAFSTLQAGQVALVFPGTYGGTDATMQWNSTGNVSAPITVSGVPGQDKPTILAEIRINGSYLRLSHFVFEGNGQWGASTENGGYPLYFNTAGAAHHIEVSFSEIFHSMKHSGVSEYGDYIWILNNYIHDNGAFEDASTYNLSHGIYIHPTSYLVIANNIIEHNRAKGISGRYDAGLVWILNNTIVGNLRAGVSITEQTHDFVFANNIFVNNGNTQGSPAINTGGSSGGTTLRQYYNMFWNNGTSGNDHWNDNAYVEGNIVADPLLVNPASSNDLSSNHVRWSNDYHLRPGSPAVGYADKRFVTPTDFDGQCRSSTSPSVGAYNP